MTAPAGAPRGAPAPHPSGDKRFDLLDAALRRHQFRPDALIEVLHAAQELFGSLSDDLLVYVGRALKLPLSRVYGVATFYHLFTLKPKGAHTCTVCLGTACYVDGAAKLLHAISRVHGVKPGETTADGRLSLVVARCVGACGVAPVVMLDHELRGNETPDALLARLGAWRAP
jgi:bidirectional [NiFe] hydrogenase diaphorase subunit